MSGRAGSAPVIATAVALLVVIGTCGLPLLYLGFAHQAAADCGSGDTVAESGAAATPSGPTHRVGRWDNTQVGAAALIVAIGRARQVPPRGWVIAVAVAMQESSLHNLPGGDRDSIGLFQQRPSEGWGVTPTGPGDRRTPEQRLADPRYAASAFYTALLGVAGWQQKRLTDAAQAVQRSGTPEAYQVLEREAEAVVTAVNGGTPVDAIGGGPPAAPCGPSDLPAASPGAKGWVAPVRASVGSGFRPPDRPGHNGVDLIAPRHTLIHAAAAGVVTVAKCNASTGTCDRDGGVSVKGCGWYVDIDHGGGVTTRYCHMVTRPFVTVGQHVGAGQAIGRVGSSGNSSGPHLHFETHVNDQPVNPVPFMAVRGVRLGGSG